MATACAFSSSWSFSASSNADPDPCAAAPLIAAAQVNGGAVAIDADEFVATPAGVLETKLIHVKAETGVHVLNAEDWLAIFKKDKTRFVRAHPFDFPFASSGFAQGRLRNTEGGSIG
jgi:hypothetical protein